MIASKEPCELTVGLDQTAHNATWSPDSRKLVFHSETRGTTQVFEIDLETSAVKQITTGRFDFAVLSAVPGTERVLVSQQNMLRPIELARLIQVAAAC